MNFPTTWYVDSSPVLFQLVSYSYKYSNQKHYAYIVLREYHESKEGKNLKKVIIDDLPNVVFLGFLEDIKINSRKTNFWFKNNKSFKYPYLNSIPVFRAGSNFRKIYPPWKKSIRLLHGIEDYLAEACPKVPLKYKVSEYLRKVTAYIQFFKNGQSVLLRNLGKKLSINLNYDFYNQANNKNLIELNYIVRNHFYNVLIKNNIVSNNSFFRIGSDKILLFVLPISIGVFQFTNFEVKEYYEKFIEYNLLEIKNLVKKFDKPFSLFVLPHPTDSINQSKNSIEYSEFIREFVGKLKEIYEDISYVGDYIKASYSTQIAYEVFELILKPNYLLACYPSATIITSQICPKNKILANYQSKNYINVIFQKSINKFFELFGEDFINKNLFNRSSS